jgi:hypothetical protein
MKKLCFLIVLFFLGSVMWCDALGRDIPGCLPEVYNSYVLSDRLDYNAENLYEYINGGAEMYLSYGLVGMKGRKYEGEGVPQVTVEVYEMTSSENAFGVYTQSRDREEFDYGQGSQSFGDFILFWKDRYFVIVTVQRASAEGSETIRYFASLLDRAIEAKGALPGIIGALPSEGLVSGGYLYFHHYIWLNAYMFIADYNIVDIDDGCDAVLAKYGTGEDRCVLLLVEYPDEERAVKAVGKMRARFAPEMSDGDSAICLEDGTWFALGCKGRRLVAVFNGREKAVAMNLYESINK